MSDLNWRNLKNIRVPDALGSTWTPVLDYVVPKRFYRIRLLGTQNLTTWTLDGLAACSPDGHPRDVVRNSDAVVASSPLGSLIAKVGGSTADNAGLVFAVGRSCVFQVDETKAGPLYLGANDIPLLMARVGGQLEVAIEAAL